MRLKYLFVLIVLSVIFIPDKSLSFGNASKKGPIRIHSKTAVYNRNSDIVVFEKDVVVVQGGLKVESDRLTFNRATLKALAEGNVVVTDAEGGVARGKRLDIDFNGGTGSMESGKIFFKPANLHVKANKLVRSDENNYEVIQGRFTTCDCVPPEWSFVGSDVRLIRGEYLTSKNTVFYIKKVPVLYFPYLVIPVGKDRKTGFLTPGLGFSDLKGFAMYNSFFWAISRNTDATFYLDYEVERGMGEGIEYRYIRKTGSEGSFFFYHFREKDIERVRQFRTVEDNLNHPQDAEDDRWRATLEHKEELPYGIEFSLNVNEVSDDEYFLDFYKDLSERTVQKLESNLTVSKAFGKLNLVSQFRFFDDLLKDNDEDTLQRLPQITLTGSSIGMGRTQFYISLDSSVINFRRRKGIDGIRLDIHPRISLPLKPWGFFELTPQAGLRETQYWLSEGERNRGRELYDLSLSAETTFARVFSEIGDIKFRHTLRPHISYSYIPDVNQESLPSFDEVDRIVEENKVTYSLTSIVTERKQAEEERLYRDALFFQISQSFDIHEFTRDLNPNEKRRPFSVISAELNLFPYEAIAVKTKGDFDPYGHRFDKFIMSFELSDKRGDNLSVGYDYTRGSTDYVDLMVNVRFSESIEAFHRSRFSRFDETAGDSDISTLETMFGLKYNGQCWGGEIKRVERPDERIFMVSINLLGLGEVASVSGKMPERH